MVGERWRHHFGIWGRRLTCLFAGVVLTVVGTLLLLACEPCGLSNWMIGSIYKNVDAPIDHEMPVTVTSYPPSPSTVAVIGGRGEGLNCSIPWYVRSLFPSYPIGKENSPVERRFHQACVFHDLCYRHGLATYGYSQADCDHILQEQAVRICRYLNKTIDTCQLDAKKVLAGVTFFGGESYRSWDESTYFEFDPNPVRAERFVALRAVNHPFTTPPAPADPRQWLLSFDIKRSGVNVGCINCQDRPLTGAELKEANFNGQPAEPSSRQAKTTIRTAPMVSLPPRTNISAPHLLNLENGAHKLLWLNRQETHNTVLCAVVADPKNLLTQTSYDSPACHKDASERMRLASADVFAASAFPVVAGETKVFVTGLSPQRSKHVPLCAEKGASLRLYKTADISAGSGWKDAAADCLFDRASTSMGEFGLFQYPPIIKQNRHIFLSRTLVDNSASQNGQEKRDGDLRVSVFDVNFDNTSRSNTAIFDHYLDVLNTHDMMLPVAGDKDDFRVINLVASSKRKPKKGEDQFQIYETDLRTKQRYVLEMISDSEKKLGLHRSWIRRPVHVTETRGQDGTLRTSLILSRSRMSKAEGRHGAVVFEFAVLSRNRMNERPFQLQRRARCTIQYTGNLGGGHPACRRVDAIEFRSRQGLQTRIQASPLIAGDFSKQSDGRKPGDALDLALYDACASRHPIIFRPDGKGFTPVQEGNPNLSRVVTCEGALEPDQMAADIADLPALNRPSAKP